MRNDRDYIAGATIKLIVAIRDPETGAPLDPPGGVTLDGLVLGTVAVTLPSEVEFTLRTPGEYVLPLQTAGFVPGTYTWRAKAVDENDDVALSEDTFVVRSAI